ncbi:hypothetical protein BLA29_015500, partial [Euroglyphus maynei]
MRFEMKAMKVYKKEKFDKLYEIESIRTVYDKEVDHLD